MKSSVSSVAHSAQNCQATRKSNMPCRPMALVSVVSENAMGPKRAWRKMRGFLGIRFFERFSTFSRSQLNTWREKRKTTSRCDATTLTHQLVYNCFTNVRNLKQTSQFVCVFVSKPLLRTLSSWVKGLQKNIFCSPLFPESNAHKTRESALKKKCASRSRLRT